MKRFFALAAVVFWCSSTYAETITGAFGGPYWRMVPARYESERISDPSGAKLKDSLSGKKILGKLDVASAIVSSEDFQKNLQQAVASAKEQADISQGKCAADSSVCEGFSQAAYENLAESNHESAIASFFTAVDSKSKKVPARLGIGFDAIVAGVNASRAGQDDTRYSSVFRIGQWNERVALSRLSDGSVIGVVKRVGNGGADYAYFRAKKYADGRLLYQMADYLPFGAPEYESDASLSSRFKIEKGTVKWLSTQVGDSQWLSTDYDPATVKIFANSESGTDKYGAFTLGMRIIGGTSEFRLLDASTDAYWSDGKTNAVYTYSPMTPLFVIIKNASAKTLKFPKGFAPFSDAKSLCTGDASVGAISYDAYDSWFCYARPAAMDMAKVVGTRK